jgi:hypothetical protein
MSGIQPKGEAMRRAIRHVSESLERDPSQPLMAVIDDATLRYDLSPAEAEFLIRFQREAREKGPASEG